MAENGWIVHLSDSRKTAVENVVNVLAEKGIEARVVDPRQWLTWHLDASSVEDLILALNIAVGTGTIQDEATVAGLRSLLEDCEEWLND